MAKLTEPAGASEGAANPCAACTIGQDCCTHLSGLRVTEVEFERCFAAHSDKLLIARQGPVYVITPKGGAACPNWQNGGCAVYDVRPRECRLFPFTSFVRRREDAVISLGFHSDTRCPFKDRLLHTDDEARAILEDFGHEAFPSAAIEVTRETALERLERRALRAGRFLRDRLRTILAPS